MAPQTQLPVYSDCPSNILIPSWPLRYSYSRWPVRYIHVYLYPDGLSDTAIPRYPLRQSYTQIAPQSQLYLDRSSDTVKPMPPLTVIPRWPPQIQLYPDSPLCTVIPRLPLRYSYNQMAPYT